MDIVAIVIGIILCFSLVICAVIIRLKSHGLRLSIQTRASSAEVNKILVNDVTNHFKMIMLKNGIVILEKHSDEYPLLLHEFEKQLARKLRHNINYAYDTKEVEHIRKIIHRTTIQRALFHEFEKESKTDFLLKAITVYFEILKLVLFYVSSNKDNYSKFRTAEHLYKIDDFKLRLKEGETGLETISVDKSH
ncbi:hypothetical protein [Mucilaginibacter phyllosphaerae]|uniref:DUF4760 domain-containing protein n=1 Tax=Mucilaginibacter phyllosphaerae TaxID=1812349 RepID=A0A4Y8AE21_9SPHI|nr:hypothetical protein [Mucilaginibacter phyllosphaerae]MBB3970019.1 hypothetical protein [Mucilaginibacter phyllosphaerae]TEW66415.1 hypothetical protein E2R65_08265 [Mucilaginibacter phyllosphaerae]GGH09182.1 hypothetical protein GCM10007352_14520 [Mucilaginibacter phyllosphaerae]